MPTPDFGHWAGIAGQVLGGVASVTGIAVTIKAWPLFKDRFALVRERDAAIDLARIAKEHETAAVAAIEIVRSASEGWQSATQAVGTELQLMRAELASLKLRVEEQSVENRVGIQYICDILTLPEGAMKPAYPTAIKDYIIGELRKRSQPSTGIE